MVKARRRPLLVISNPSPMLPEKSKISPICFGITTRLLEIATKCFARERRAADFVITLHKFVLPFIKNSINKSKPVRNGVKMVVNQVKNGRLI
jgi:hypothetical protein